MTGSGKTTLLRILADFIPEQDRLVVIEDTSELHVERQPGRHVVREVLVLRGYDRDAKRFLIEPVFEVKHATE